jgi:hypothetical protein
MYYHFFLLQIETLSKCSAIFPKKIGSGTHRVTQNTAGGGGECYIDAREKGF